MSTSEELLPGTRRALLHRLAVGQAQGRAPSLVGAVVRGGRTVWCDSRSMLDAHRPDGDVQYRIGSITKSFVAVLVMRLVDEGVVGLDDALERHLPCTVAGHVTVRQLLSHTSGLASETPVPWWERTPGSLRPAVADILSESPAKHDPGSRFHYSNPGFALLGALVERVRGAGWYEVLRAEVLAPLGMDRTTVLPEAPHAGGFAVHPWADVMLPEPLEDTGVMGPAGQLWSTVADLGRFAVFLTGGDERVLSGAALAAMRTPATAPENAEWTSGYGLGLQVKRDGDRSLFGHGGSMPGFVAGLWICEADDVAAIVLANATSGVPVSSLAAELIGLVAELEPRIPEPWRPLETVPEPELLALTGPWYWGAAPFALRLRAERGLELVPLGLSGRAARFRAEPDGTWTGLDGYYAGETLCVVRGADGLVSHLDIGSFVLTRGPYAPGEVVPGGVDDAGWRV
ncbi:serine hydrolase domain-containing protein [Streptantibioticus silvisoli]|uniref:Serine hydrolase domain-containing protein n=1 Tax=Streptantibioticus silvisoli TaxID=2705255 RepID=A0ABT6W358_9ACTN|nr:serine hydrolase domain-containing protein [Streptantibioticus silvisoli]MDI5965175.1 serine hydrolase domain-containing protein [Streptantibioticus silvisoli]